MALGVIGNVDEEAADRGGELLAAYAQMSPEARSSLVSLLRAITSPADLQAKARQLA